MQLLNYHVYIIWLKILLLQYFLLIEIDCVVPLSEINALQEFYVTNGGQYWLWRNSTDSFRGSEWHFEQSDTTVNPCAENGDTWQGISCSELPILCERQSRTCYITAISLPDYNITGQISSSLGLLSQLELLNIPKNGIIGSIPTTFGALNKLEVLQLFDNYLTGTLPPELFSMTALTNIDISFNQLHGRLSSLLGQLSNLVDLDLGHNCFSNVLPTEIYHLTLLEELTLGTNKFHGNIPMELGHCTRVREFDLEENYFTGDIFPIVLNMSNLRGLDMSKNVFSSSVPTSINRLIELKYLEMSSNNLHGSLPESIYLLTNLLNWDVRYNDFTGTISSSIGNLASTIFLEMEGNFFHGSIPRAVGGLSAVRSFTLSNNLLTGTIPREMFFCSVLNDIQLLNNDLTGTLPSEMTNLVPLSDFSVKDNLLTGIVPTAIEKLSILHTIYLTNNYFSGQLPIPIRLTSLVDVSQNLFTGSISNLFSPRSPAQFLYMQGNYFTGTIPNALSDYSQLVHLFLFDNQFSGTVPSFQNMSFLESVLLQKNKFTGQPDEFVKGATSLEVLDLSWNRFSKDFPELLWSLPALNYVSIVGACFGKLPEAICGCDTLEVLVLEGLHSGYGCENEFWDPIGLITEPYYVNEVDGSLPECIWQMSQLLTLHLSGNLLQGSIPADVNLPSILSLSLVHNRFTGTLPRSFLQQAIQRELLERMDFSHNKFSGSCDAFSMKNMSTDSIQNTALKLNVNRLSGDIPPEFSEYQSIDILAGNVFQCSTDRSELPSGDPDRVNYICGSDAFDLSILVWLIVCIAPVIIVGAACAVSRHQINSSNNNSSSSSSSNITNRGIREKLTACSTCIHIWYNCLTSWEEGLIITKCSTSISTTPHFARLLLVLRHLRSVTVSLAILICCTYGVLYIVGKTVLGWGSHEYQYRWLPTSAYLNNGYAALWMMAFFVLVIVLVVTAQATVKIKCAAIDTPITTTNTDTSSIISSGKKHRRSVLFVAGLVSGHLTIILAVKIFILYSLDWTNASAPVKILLQVTVSIFDIMWNSVVIPYTVNAFPDYLRSDRRITLILLLLLFNSIIAPVIGTAAVDRSCFARLFSPEDSIETSYTHPYCARFSTVLQQDDGETECSRQLFLSLSTSFQPPFTYSYACSSALISTFVPSLMFTYTFTMIGLPLICGALSMLYRANAFARHSFLFTFMRNIFPIIFLPHSAGARIGSDANTTKTGSTDAVSVPYSATCTDAATTYTQNTAATVRLRPMVGVRILIARMLHSAAVLLTFGVASPLLAVLIAIDSVVKTGVWLVLFGRYLYLSKPTTIPSSIENGYIGSESFPMQSQAQLLTCLEVSCDNVWLGPTRCTFLLIAHSCAFFAILMIDIAGDEIGWKNVVIQYWIPIVCLPFFIYAIVYVIMNFKILGYVDPWLLGAREEGIELELTTSSAAINSSTMNISRNESKPSNTMIHSPLF